MEVADYERCIRITPACAGTTLSCQQSGGTHEDHPRMCGAYHMWKVLVDRAEGSPPHVRGLQYVVYAHNKKSRITPACAGTTASDVG